MLLIHDQFKLGVHFAQDNGQSLGLALADTIFEERKDPAVGNIEFFKGDSRVASLQNLPTLLVNEASSSGFYGRDLPK